MPALFLFAVPCSLFPLHICAAADRTVAVSLGDPLEISLSAPESLAEWVVKDFPANLLEQVSVKRMPNETVFVFRPLAPGGGTVRFLKQVTSGAPGAIMVAFDVDVMITSGTAPLEPYLSASKSPPGPAMPADTSRGAASRPAAGRRPGGWIWDDPVFRRMLHGRLGFPARNPRAADTETEEDIARRMSPLPYSLTYIFPEGSYLLNPSHHLPLPDTPPGFKSIPPAYHQALQLARRGLHGEASKVLDEMIEEMKKKKKTVPRAILAFYEFVNAHLQMELGQYEDAVRRFKTLFEDKDYGLGSRFYAALSTENSGDTLGAITAYQGVVSHDPQGYFTPEAAYRIARIFLRAKAYDRAIEEYKNFITTYPRSAFIDDTFYDLAGIYDQIYEYQDFDIALKLYDSVLQEFTGSPFTDTVAARKRFVLENYF